MIEWLWPWAFAALPLPWLIRRLTQRRRLQQPALVVPSIEDFSAVTAADHTQGSHSPWRLIALSLAWALGWRLLWGLGVGVGGWVWG